jgi:hypothetical protein
MERQVRERLRLHLQGRIGEREVAINKRRTAGIDTKFSLSNAINNYHI